MERRKADKDRSVIGPQDLPTAPRLNATFYRSILEKSHKTLDVSSVKVQAWPARNKGTVAPPQASVLVKRDNSPRLGLIYTGKLYGILQSFSFKKK